MWGYMIERGWDTGARTERGSESVSESVSQPVGSYLGVRTALLARQPPLLSPARPRSCT